MTDQEVFDKVVTHLRQQNKRVSGFYLYEGLKCAIGCLIPNDEYVEEMEGKGVFALLNFVNNKELFPITSQLLSNDQYLLLELQYLHDAHLVSDWEDKLKKIAQRFHLKYTEKE